MSAISNIEWTDRTWNPVRGCSIVSPGCINCYAMKFAHRFSGPGKPYEGLTKQTSAGPQWTGKIRTVDDALTEPLKWRKPQRVFVNSMSDLFHEGVPDQFIDRVFAVMAIARRHTFQVLTKRPARMRDYMLSRAPKKAGHVLPPEWLHYLNDVVDAQDRNITTRFGERGTGRGHWPMPNVWLGVSCEDQQRADERIPLLLETPAAVRFVSAEPLIGPIRFELEADSVGNIDWVIVGGESGPGARPCDVAWVRSIVDECAECLVPVFVKQLGAIPFTTNAAKAAPLARVRKTDGNYWLTTADSKGGDPSEWPADLRVRQFPSEARS